MKIPNSYKSNEIDVYDGRSFLKYLAHQAFDDTRNILRFKGDLRGWMDPILRDTIGLHMSRIYHQQQRPLLIIEVGTWKGLSSITMASIAKELHIPCKIVCVDTWLGAPEFWTKGINDPTLGISLIPANGYPQVYYTFLRNVVDNGFEDVIVPFPISSNEAVEVFKFYGITADIIYVDAAHEYEAVKNDITRYWALLEHNGCMLGDDFHESWPGVRRAVSEYASENNVSYKVDGVVWSMIAERFDACDVSGNQF
jgi:hypothetical protein